MNVFANFFTDYIGDVVLSCLSDSLPLDLSDLPGSQDDFPDF